MSRCCIYCRIGGTANEPNQIAMNSQLEMLRKAAEDLVLIVDPSRLSRSTEGYTLIGQKLNRHGIRVYTPQGKIQLPPPHAFFYSRYHKEGENDFGPGK